MKKINFVTSMIQVELFLEDHNKPHIIKWEEREPSSPQPSQRNWQDQGGAEVDKSKSEGQVHYLG